MGELLEMQTQLSFQEDTVAQLNEVVTRQQKDIERLTEAIAQLKKQLDEIAPVERESQEEEPPPPHY
ncbi:MAG: SlyX family protein [Endozoicomonas sp.]